MIPSTPSGHLERGLLPALLRAHGDPTPPPRITVSLATRGRKAELPYAIDSLVVNAANPHRMTIVVAMDDDDDTTFDNLWGSCVIESRAPREDCMGDKWNRALGIVPAEIYVGWSDDGAVLTKGWDDKLREALPLFPDGHGVFYFGEAPSGVLALNYAVTRQWADRFGGLFIGHFPVWFQDMWLDELAVMTGRDLWVDIAVGSIGGRGKTRGLRDLLFWNDFFDETRGVREAQADTFIDAFYRDMPFRAYQLRWLRKCHRLIFNGRSAYIKQTADQSMREQAFDAPADERYLRTKAAAEAYLASLNGREAA